MIHIPTIDLKWLLRGKMGLEKMENALPALLFRISNGRKDEKEKK